MFNIHDATNSDTVIMMFTRNKSAKHKNHFDVFVWVLKTMAILLSIVLAQLFSFNPTYRIPHLYIYLLDVRAWSGMLLECSRCIVQSGTPENKKTHQTENNPELYRLWR